MKSGGEEKVMTFFLSYDTIEYMFLYSKARRIR